MRMAVAGEEALQPQHVAVVGPADDDRAAGAGFQQAHAAQDQRAHDALAELGLGNEQGAQLRRRNDDDLDRLACDGVDQGRTAAKLRQLAHEASGLMGHDQRALAAVRLKDVDLPREDNHQSGAASPTRASASPAANERTSPKRHTRSISSGSSDGNIWARRVAMID